MDVIKSTAGRHFILIVLWLMVARAGCAQSIPQPGLPTTDREGYFNSRGVRIRYLVNGSQGAECVVFVNGFTEGLEVWSDVVAAPPLKRYRLIRFDTRGLGLSDKPHGAKEYGMEMVNDVTRLLDHLQIKKAHIVGYSMGAWIVLKLVTSHPERVITATLGGSAGLHNAQVERNLIIADAIEGKDISAAVRKLVLPDGAGISDQDAKETERAFIDLGKEYSNQFDPQAIASMMRGFAELVVADRDLKRNTVPVLALYSNEDDAGRPLAGQIAALRNRMPNVVLMQIKDANHGNARSKPQFVESLVEFLARHSPSGSEK